MHESNLHITRLFLEEKNDFWRLPTGTFHILLNYVMNKYDLHKTSLFVPVDTIIGRSKYVTTA